MDRLKSGAAGLGLDLTARQLRDFEVYYRGLVAWNRRVNLTAVTGYEEAQVIHFLDSLTVISGFPPPAGRQSSVIDVGTGAGLPGIPLRIVLPEIRLVLLEATARKVEFLRYITAELALDDVAIVRGRAEEVARDEAYRERFDIAVSRALAPLNVLAELTLPFCRIGGRLIAQKKGDISREINEAGRAVGVMGGGTCEVRDITLDEFDDDRCLVIVEKIGATPPEYPRRPGIPGKRPVL